MKAAGIENVAHVALDVNRPTARSAPAQEIGRYAGVQNSLSPEDTGRRQHLDHRLGGRREPRSAFTLVEVLAALMFLGLVIPVAVRAIMIANRAAVVSERSVLAGQLGENRLNELMLANAWTTAESRGTFEGHPGYRWELKKQDWETGAMSELTMEIFYQVQGSEQSVKLSTLVNEEIGEP